MRKLYVGRSRLAMWSLTSSTQNRNIHGRQDVYSPMMDANPYRAPEAAIPPAPVDVSAPMRLSFGRCLVRWVLLGAINAVVGALFALGLFDNLADLAGIAVGFFLVVFTVTVIDFRLRERNQAFLVEALFLGATARAVLQLLLIADVLIGIVAFGAVAWLTDYVPGVSALLVTLVFGFLTFALAFVIGLVLNALVRMANRRPSG